MHVSKDGTIVTEAWARLDEDQIPANAERLLVTSGEWTERQAEIRATGASLGLLLEGDETVDAFADDLHDFTLIAVQFPKFTDGRGFSLGRLISQRHEYQGELRALGPLIQDQYLLAQRCGFDSIETEDPAAARAWEEAGRRYRGFYQPAVRDRLRARAEPPRRRSVGAAATPGPVRHEATIAGAWAY